MKTYAPKILIRTALHFAFYSVTVAPVLAADISFSGQLDVVQEDLGGAVYSGVPVSTVFSGAINDVTFSGFISDGTTITQSLASS